MRVKSPLPCRRLTSSQPTSLLRNSVMLHRPVNLAMLFWVIAIVSPNSRIGGLPKALMPAPIFDEWNNAATFGFSPAFCNDHAAWFRNIACSGLRLENQSRISPTTIGNTQTPIVRLCPSVDLYHATRDDNPLAITGAADDPTIPRQYRFVHHSMAGTMPCMHRHSFLPFAEVEAAQPLPHPANLSIVLVPILRTPLLAPAPANFHTPAKMRHGQAWD